MARLLISIILLGLMLEQVLSNVVTNDKNVQAGQMLPTTIPDPAMAHFLNQVFSTANQMATAGPKPRSSWTSLIVRSVIPLANYVMSYGGKGAILFGQTMLVLFTGFMITVGICTLTPFCMINWQSFGITNSQSKNQANQLVGFLTSQDALDMLTTAISEAIEQSSDTIKHSGNPHYYPQQPYPQQPYPYGYANQPNYFFPNVDRSKLPYNYKK